MDTIAVHSQTVDDNQRVVRCVQRRTTTNTDSSTTARGTTAIGDVHTGHLTLKGILRIGDQTLVHFIGFDGRYRTCQVILLGTTITDDHHVLENSSIVNKCNYKIRRSLHRLGLITHVTDGDVCTLISFQHEVTVEIGHSGRLCTSHAHGCADNGFACSIFHMAFDLYLGKGTYRQEQT